jgi:16S rRNA (guanine(966)-N(2))-methyltransferase RsmD
LVRITGGKLKGRMVVSTADKGLRPTTSFFREWIFNVLSNMLEISEVTLLDLFSGTGIVSFEFISRGALRSTCVDKSRDMCSIVSKSAGILNISEISAVNSECTLYLEKIMRSGEFGFNTVFIDAPYGNLKLTENVVEQLFSKPDILPEDVTIIIETPKSFQLKIADGFSILKTKATGSSKMEIVRKKFD